MAKKQLSTRQYIQAIARVGLTSFRIAPSAGVVRLFDSVMQATLPIATTYLAARTTTLLAEAYGGDEHAQQTVLLYVIATSLVSVITFG